MKAYRNHFFSLLLLFLLSPLSAQAAVCDVDADNDIDIDDVQAILGSINQPSSGPSDPRDPDSDGLITILDARFCVLQCSLPGCARPVANRAPVADAGPDQTAFVNDIVTLNGSGSSDADGDPLTFAWTLTTPPGSSATLSDPTAVAPTFEIDLPGNYEATLVVNDGSVPSAPDSVTISTLNSSPVADAGPDQTAFVFDTVTLDGAGSSDVDGDPLTFSWSLLPPAGSTATLSDPTAVMPTFSIDVFGDYVAELIVNDGLVDSAPDSVTVSTLNSAPVADAGPDQSAFVLDTVTLNGSASSDVDGNPLTFSWSLTPPPGSAATLSDPTAVTPTFSVDVFGDYVAQLIVNDGLIDSAPDTITVSTLNSPPVADAGPDQTAFVLDTVTLNGSGSFDVDGDPLTFFWSLTAPPGSSAVLSDPNAVAPSFDVDLPGTYVAQLIVNDGLVGSAPDTIAVSTLNSPPVADAGPDQTAFVLDTVTLDGSGSFDVDGDPVSFFWSLSAPAGSAAALSDPTAAAPSFVVDLPGTYVAQLIVNDGLVGSAPDTVTISTQNSAPVADAGPDQTARVSDTVTLDGSASDDVDGDALSFFWSLSRPAGSSAFLSDPTAVAPTFVPDIPGDYVAQLIVNDGAVDSAPDTSLVTVSVLPTLSVNSAATAEGDTSATSSIAFEVVLTPASPVPVTVSVETADQTASAGADYQAVSPTILTFAPGETTKTVSVTVIGDDLVELDETFLLQLSGPVNATIATGTGTGTIFDDDAATLTLGDAILAEGDAGTTNLVFSVTLDSAVDAGVTVDFASADGSATVAGGDYAAASGTLSFTGNAGETQTITVAVSGDALVELDETFSLLLSNVQAAGRDLTLADDTGLGTIVNDDSASLVVNDVTLAEGDAGTTDFVFTVTLDNGVDTGLTVDFASLDGSATVTDGDYAGASGTLTFAGNAGENQTITVAVNGDAVVELNETFSVVLANVQSAGRAVSLADDTGLGTIVNDDGASLAIGDVTLAEGDAGSTDFVFTVTLDTAIAGGLTVDFASLDGSATVADGDYAAASGTLTFAGAAGETQTITVPVNGDAVVELDETFSVVLSNLQAGGGAVTLADDTGFGTIVNDDGATLSIDDVTLAEGDAGTAGLVFTVTLDSAVATGFTVDFDSLDGSATVADADYAAASGTLSFAGAAGETQTITVPVNGDAVVELDETFSVVLSNLQAGGSAVTLADDTGLGTIVNDDSATLVINDILLAEGDTGSTGFVFSVTLDSAVDTGLTVDFASLDGSATVADGDYAAASGTLSFAGAAGETQTLTVAVNGDAVVELDETFSVVLANLQPAGRSVTLADDTGLGTITNDDSATLFIDDVTLAEGDSGTADFIFTVSIDSAVATGFTVDFDSLDGSATVADADYAAASGTLSFTGAAGETQTLTVAVNGDAVVELDETFSVVLSNLQAGGQAVTLADDTGLGTITNDDAATLSIDDVTLAEGNAGTVDFVFTVTLDSAVAAGFSVDFASLDGSATVADGDYAAASGTLTFAGTAGEIQTLTVAVNGDAVVELDETFSVVLSNLQAGSQAVTLADDTGLGTITNDDAATLVIDDVTLAEGNSGTTDFVFTVTLDNAVDAGLTVDFASLDGSAIAVDGDYANAAGTLSFAGNAGEIQTATVAVNGDAVLELDEDFSVLLANLQASGRDVTLADDTGLGTIQNDDSVTVDIGDVSQAEGDAGTTQFQFEVTLTGNTAIPVSLTADSADGTATAGSDYVALSAFAVDFAPGEALKTVSIEVPGDTDVEPSETFLVDLSTSQPGVVLGDGQGEGTIGNDDAALSIGDVSLAEGDSGTVDFVFSVSIAQASVLPVSVTAQSADGTATESSGDYVALGATTVDIPVGSTSATVTVQVNGDTDSEPDETFFVDLSAPVNATLADAQGQGTIQNDDATLPGIGLAIVAGGPPVGVTRSATVQVTLASPAPAGGITVTVTSDSPSILGVAAPGTISIPGGSSTGNITVNGNGEGSTALRANASGYLEGSLVVPVTLNLISIPETLTVPLGQTTSLPVSITPNPAPAGGLIIQLNGSNPGAVDIQTPTVTIPAGQFSTNAIVFGVAPGNSTVTATNPSYAPDTGVVTTSADLNILQSSLTINDTFPNDIDIQLQVGGAPVSAPAPGITVTVTSDDPSCVTTTSPVFIATGLVNTTSTISYGGAAALPCSANVTVSAPSINSDTIPVTVNPTPGISLFGLPLSVGAGLQANCCLARLGTTQHGGVTMRVESLDPGVALVAPDGVTPGTAFIDVFVPNGSRDVPFHVQGLEGQAGNTATIQGSAPGFNVGTDTVSVLPVALDILNLITTLDTLDPDDPFTVRTGIGSAASLTAVQAVRAGAPGPLVIDVDNSNLPVGDLVTTPLIADSVTVEIPPGSSSTPSSVAAGGVAFRSVSAGTTTVTVSAPGAITTANGIRSVTVTNPVISLLGSFPVILGEGLQYNCCTARLGATQHGGVTVRVESLDPTVALISPDASTPGTPFIDVFVANGSRDVSFHLQGLEGQAGNTATIQASAPGFGNVSNSVNVVQAALDILNLVTTLDTLDPDDPFTVRLGIGNASNLTLLQAVRAGAPGPLVIDVDNSNLPVADLVTSALIADAVTVEIPPGSSSSPSSVASGGVALRSISAGTTTVSVSSPGLLTTANGSRTVTITNPVISMIGNFPYSLGEGLQDLCCTARLGATQHGGVTVRIESLDPTVALVSPNAVTPGTPFIDVFVANGSRDVSFYVQGLEGQAGNIATIQASAPGFGSDSGTISVVQPALDILSLTTPIDTLDPIDPFQVRIGLGGSTGLTRLQAVRAGAPAALVVTVDSSAPGIGRLVTSALTSGTVTAEIVPGQSVTPSSVASGGVAFEPLTSGTTTVSASIPGFVTTPNGSRSVTVTTPTIAMSGLPATVGAGLQEFCCTAQLSATQHGGVDVTLTSSNPAVALIAPDQFSPGVASFTTTVPNGSRNVSFVVHGLEGALGTVQIIAEASGFIDGSGTLTVVQPALDILNLNLNPSAAAADDPFLVRIGFPNATATGLQRLQSIRVGGVPANLTITSSAPAVGQLVTTATTGGTVNLTIPIGSSQTPASVAGGGVAFDPLTQGSTTVEASIPGFITTGNGTRSVTVGP